MCVSQTQNSVMCARRRNARFSTQCMMFIRCEWFFSPIYSCGFFSTTRIRNRGIHKSIFSIAHLRVNSWFLFPTGAFSLAAGTFVFRWVSKVFFLKFLLAEPSSSIDPKRSQVFWTDFILGSRVWTLGSPSACGRFSETLSSWALSGSLFFSTSWMGPARVLGSMYVQLAGGDYECQRCLIQCVAFFCTWNSTEADISPHAISGGVWGWTTARLKPESKIRVVISYWIIQVINFFVCRWFCIFLALSAGRNAKVENQNIITRMFLKYYYYFSSIFCFQISDTPTPNAFPLHWGGLLGFLIFPQYLVF